jgi:hypothetical protein
VLLVTGAGGAPGRSVTAWLRPSLDGEAAAEVRGVAGAAERDDLVLRHRFGVASPPVHERTLVRIGQAVLLVGIGGLLAAGAMSLRRRDEVGVDG